MDVPNAITKSQNIFNDKSFNVKFNDSYLKLNDSDIIYNIERLSNSKEQKNKNTKELE